MAKYDASGDLIRRKVPVSLITLFVGIVILVLGIILVKVFDMDKFYETMDINETIDAKNVTSVDIEYGFGELRINRSEDDNIHINGKASYDNLEFEVDGSTFKVESDDFTFGNSWKFVSFGDSRKNDITISLPDKIYEEFKLDNGEGKSVIEDVRANDADFDFGAGELQVKNSYFINICNIDLGVGKGEFERCYCGEVNLDCAVGEIVFSGVITKDSKIDCGVGSCTLNLQGDESNYKITGDILNNTSNSDAVNIKVSTGLGNAKFGYGEDYGLAL